VIKVEPSHESSRNFASSHATPVTDQFKMVQNESGQKRVDAECAVLCNHSISTMISTLSWFNAMDATAKKYGKIPEISDINANASIIDEVRAMQLCLLKSDEWKNELHGRLTTMLNGSAIKNWMHHSTAKLNNHIFPENVEDFSIASSPNGDKIDVDGTKKVSATSNSDMIIDECLDDGNSNRQVKATMDRALHL